MRRIQIRVASLAVMLMLAGHADGANVESSENDMDELAERYVRLVLAVGQHDADYVDAYYGPPEWRKEAEAAKRPLTEIDSQATAVLASLGQITPAPSADELMRLRHEYLTKQLQSLQTRADMLQGKKLSFDEEAKALYDVEPPTHTEAEFARIVAELAKRLPALPRSGSTGSTVAERYEAYRMQFVIPKDRLDQVFRAAIDGCRQRTASHIKLPPGESFTVEYVTGKSWSGYNWYQGRYRSLIQVNTDLPIYVDRALDLACHEGYPGHHVYNSLLEKHLVREREWVSVPRSIS